MLRGIYSVFIIFSFVNGLFGLDCSKRLHSVLEDKEIRVFNEKKTYPRALQACRKWGKESNNAGTGRPGRIGRLAFIKSQEDQQCIQQMISNPENYHPEQWDDNNPLDSGYFVGATDRATEGFWKWLDGSDIEAYTNWAYHEPDDRLNQDCLQVLLGNTTYADYKTGKWIDAKCSDKKFFICERDISSAPLWGYKENSKLPPSKWAEKYPLCGESNQSPIDLSINMQTSADVCDESAKHIKGWGVSPGSNWTIENTGRFIKVKIQNSTMWTAFFATKGVRRPPIMFIDYFIIKWGSEEKLGSEHSIGGRKKHGELQVYHQPTETGEVYAFAFFISMRTFGPNENWATFLNNIALVQLGGTTTMAAPFRGIGELLGDSFGNGMTKKSLLTSAPLRYRGTLPHPPCSKNVIWTVYPTAVFLSSSQFRTLRLMYQDKRRTTLSNNFRPLQKTTIKPCMISPRLSGSRIQ